MPVSRTAAVTRRAVRRAARTAAATAAVAMTAAVVGAGTATAAAPPLSPTDQRVHDMLTARSGARALGPDLAGIVTDATTGRVLWGQTPNERQLPASNAKIVTAVNALTEYGPTYRFTTRVLQGGGPRQVVLVGSGDPTLTGGSLGRLARGTAHAMLAKGIRRVAVQVDDTLFPAPTLAHGWKSTYVLEDVAAVRALGYDQRRVRDTSMDAARYFARRLTAMGVSVGHVYRRAAPAGAATLATANGRALATMIGTMLRESDNDYAEALHRLVADKAGYPTTWTGAADAQRAVLLAAGVDMRTSVLYDGSGLSRADRLSPRLLTQVLALAFDGRHPRLAPLTHNALAIAGQTGTLGPRYLRYTTRPTRCAAGLIEAKTGSLSGVITLSGFARGADGATKLFSFLLNGVPSTLTTRRAVDRLAATITGCW